STALLSTLLALSLLPLSLLPLSFLALTLLALTLLAPLSLLPLLTLLTLLPLLALLATLGRRLPLLHLLPQLFELRQRLLRHLAVLTGPPLAIRPHGLVDAPQTVAQIAESSRHVEFGEGRIRGVAAADVLSVTLHIARQLRLLFLGESLAHFGGCLGLGAPQVAHGVLHALFELLDRK